VKTILVIANETLGGAKLFERVQEKLGGGDGGRVVVCVPRNRPKHGNLIYDDAVFDAARVRIDLARGYLRERGIEAVGEVGDPDPYPAAMDAVADYAPDEIIVSTLPATSSGWLRRDLPERIAEASGIPVDHVVVDIEQEGLPFSVSLVLAARTASGDELLKCIRSKAEGSRDERLFIIVVPQEGGDGSATAKARARLTQVVDRIRASNLVAAGMIGDPDPYTAAMNALQFFRVDDIVVSTLPATRSGWLRADLIARLRRATGKDIVHVEAPAPAAHTAA
jgi:hypothetical protein